MLGAAMVVTNHRKMAGQGDGFVVDRPQCLSFFMASLKTEKFGGRRVCGVEIWLFLSAQDVM